VQRYTPYGETRGSETVDVPYQFTGQRNEDAIGLYHYGARWYDPALGRVIQADTIVPQPEDPQSLNRYAYVYNNPLKYTDPTGHYTFEGDPSDPCMYSTGQVRSEHYWTHPEAPVPDPVTWGEVASVVFAPLWASTLVIGTAAAAEGIATEAAIPALKTIAAAILKAFAADGDPTNEARQAASWAPQGSKLIQRWGPHTGQGPLEMDKVSSFRSSSYSELLLTEDTAFYRTFSDPARKIATFWTRVRPAGPLQAQIDLALLPEYGNEASHVARILAPAGTRIYEGAVAPMANDVLYLAGGGNQVVILGVDPSWLTP
jgi:RHS repeat-associated protein